MKVYAPILFLLFAVQAWTQPDSSGTGTAYRIVKGGTLPSTCSVGAVYYKTGTGAGQYNCTAANTWTAVGSPPTGGAVGGASGLTEVGNVPRVTAAGILGSTNLFSVGNDLLWGVDGTGNIGASGANRPNNIYINNLVSGYQAIFGDSIYLGANTGNHPTLRFSGANLLIQRADSASYSPVTADPGGTVPARKDYTLVCQANTTAAPSGLTSIVVSSNAATATCAAGGCGLINGQTAYVIGATSDADLNAAYVIAGSTGVTDTTVTFTTASVTDGTYNFASDAGMSLQGCLLNGASYTGNIAAAVVMRPVLFSLTAGSKVIGNTVIWPAAWTGPATLTGSIGATSGTDDTFYAAASNLMAATGWLDTASYKSKLHGTADNVVAAITANTNFGDGTLPILKLNGSMTVSVTW
jgi:hypothetical protein